MHVPFDLLNKLKEGSTEWNAWRLENAQAQLFFPFAADLSNANLIGANLRNATLLYANLTEANLTGCDLTDADLSSSNLTRVQLNGATLINASLRGANCSGANLSSCNLESASLQGAVLGTHHRFEWDVVDAPEMNGTIKRHESSGRSVQIKQVTGQGEVVFYISDKLQTNLSKSNLQKADLRGVSFINTILEHASISQATLGRTTMDCNLSSVVGLDDTRHQGPSTLSNYALFSLKAPLPETFLKGCGLSDEEINLARARLNSGFYSCFMSYSSKDEKFARQLYSYLRNQGVDCLIAPDDLKIGERFRNKIEDSIKRQDKLLLILSSNSISSPWVEEEVETAFELEHREKREVLFPIRIDDSVMSSEQPWVASIRRKRQIGDFTNWEETEIFFNALKTLLRDLKANQQDEPNARLQRTRPSE